MYKNNNKNYIKAGILSFIVTLALSINLGEIAKQTVAATSSSATFFTNFILPLRESINGFGISKIIIFIGLLLMFIIPFSNKNNIKARHIVPSVFLSLFMVIGKAFQSYKTLSILIFSGGVQLVKAVFVLIGYFILFCAVMYYIELFFCYLREKKPVNSKFTTSVFDKKPFLCPFLIILVIYLIFLGCNYPGLIMGDSRDQICQFFGEVDWTAAYLKLLSPSVVINNHHPVLSTLVIGSFIKLGEVLFHSDNAGLFMYCIFQATALAAAEGYTIKYITSFKLPNFVRIFTLLFYALLPSFMVFGSLAVKDTYFVIALIFYMISYAELLRFPEKIIKKPSRMIVLIISIIALCLFRNNGIYVVVFSLPFVCCVQKKLMKKILPLSAAILVLWFAYSSFLLPALKITPGSKREVLSVPFQQTARYVKTYPSEVTAEEKSAIGAVLDYDSLAELYRPKRSDEVKNTFNEDATSEDMSAYLKTWFTMFTKHPAVYFEATINNTYGYVYPVSVPLAYTSANSNKMFYKIDTLHGFSFSYPDNTLNARSLTREYYTVFGKLPVVSFLQSSAVYTWFILIGVIFSLTYKKKKQFVNYLPSIILVLTCFVSPVDGSIYFRYILPVAAIVPILLANQIYYFKEDKELKKIDAHKAEEK